MCVCVCVLSFVIVVRCGPHSDPSALTRRSSVPSVPHTFRSIRSIAPYLTPTSTTELRPKVSFLDLSSSLLFLVRVTSAADCLVRVSSVWAFPTCTPLRVSSVWTFPTCTPFPIDQQSKGKEDTRALHTTKKLITSAKRPFPYTLIQG